VVNTWKKVNEVKVVDEIRMVYDVSKSDLNNTVFDPWFAMPTAESHLRSVKAGTYMADCDVGEIFLNFMLEPEVRPYARVDLSRVFFQRKLQLWEGISMVGRPGC